MVTFLRPCSKRPGQGSIIALHEGGLGEDSADKDGQVERVSVREPHRSPLRRDSYKEALLRPVKKHYWPSSFVHEKRVWLPRGVKSSQSRRGVSCFRCLASDHRVAACRNPARCRDCRRTGHKTFQCRWRESRSVGVGSKNMNRAYRGRGRVPRLKAAGVNSGQFD